MVENLSRYLDRLFSRLEERVENRVVERVEAYAKAQGIFHTPDAPEGEYSDLLELDLADHVNDPTWQILTDRERQVLRLLARGRAYRAIADDARAGLERFVR